MTPSRHVNVTIDLGRIRANAERIVRSAGVDVMAVVKADAYGLGAPQVVDAIGDLVAGFFVFDVIEAARDRIFERTGKPTIALLGESWTSDDYIAHRVRPVVWTEKQVRSLSAARPVLMVDTGQQRFACAPEMIDAVVKAGAIEEAMTHASTPEQVERFRALTDALGLARRHVAGSSLLDRPDARFDAVRPGLALYDGAARVSTRLVDARNTRGPAGYSGFITARHGVMVVGYSNGLRPGVCLVNGQRRRIVETGMQSSFVELGPGDRVGDEVVLLGDDLPLAEVARSWQVGPHEALVRLTDTGPRAHRK